MDHLKMSLRAISSSTSGMKAGSSKGQFASLAQQAASISDMVVEHEGRLQAGVDVDAVLHSTSWLRALTTDIQRQKTYNLCKLLINRAERLATIDAYRGGLDTIQRNFQLPASTSAPISAHWNIYFHNAWREDERLLDQHLEGLAFDDTLMAQELGFDGTNAVPIIARLQWHLNHKSEDKKEINFINAAISYLSFFTSEDRVVDLEPWMITAFDVDIGLPIGAGSLGKVFRGRWKRRDVAIKMLRTKHDILPRSGYAYREMETWSKLHHPNVLPFLGGNTLDNDPFIVLPFLKHQTSRDYLQKYPDCDRLGLLYETSLGLLYLHSEKIIHGNIKGVNILVNDAGKPQLCDYGLAKLKADINSRSSVDLASSPFWGSQNWMAPELFDRGILTFQCDIYSFGMTMYEILADEIPLGYVPLGRLYNLVVERDIRPERPDQNEDKQFSDAAWGLAEKCWGTFPTHRIKLSTLSEKLAALLPSSAGDGLPGQPPSIFPLSSEAPSTNTLPPTGLRPEAMDGMA